MKVVFQTHSLFLVNKFPRVRSRLVGVVGEMKRRVAEEVPSKKTKKLSGKKLKIANFILSMVMILSLGAAIFVLTPAIFYRFFPADVIEIDASQTGSPLGGEFEESDSDTHSQPEAPKEKYLPPQNENLPEGDWLIIPRIGVRTQLQPTEDPEEALQTGVWQVPDFGVPGDDEIPMILAAHRFGWEWWWQSDYWKYHSFYNLPETEPGDIIEIISDQRKWIYEIYAGEEGEEITDYDADLILYTCKFLQSPIRHFRYARLIDPTVDTQ